VGRRGDAARVAPDGVIAFQNYSMTSTYAIWFVSPTGPQLQTR